MALSTPLLLAFFAILGQGLVSGFALRRRAMWPPQDYHPTLGRDIRNGYAQVHAPFISDQDTAYGGHNPSYLDDDDVFHGYNDVMPFEDFSQPHPWNSYHDEGSPFGKDGGVAKRNPSLHDILAKLHSLGGDAGNRLRPMRFGTGRR